MTNIAQKLDRRVFATSRLAEFTSVKELTARTLLRRLEATQEEVMAKPSAPTSWRDVLKIHPAAELFPMMSPDELRELGEDIKKNGLHSPVYLGGKPTKGARGELVLVDGRNRLDAMEAAGLPVLSKDGSYLALDLPHEFLDSKIDPYEFVLSANIHRRHLTAEQKRELIAEVLKATPEKSNRQVAKMVGVSHPHVASVRSDLEKSGDVETVTTSIDTKGRKQPARKKRRDVDDYLAEKRERMAKGDVETVTTSVNTEGRQQPASRPPIKDPAVTAAADRAEERATQAEPQTEPDDVGPESAGKTEGNRPNGARALMASRQEPADGLDYFPTPPWATRALIQYVLPDGLGISWRDLKGLTAWEPACGEGHMTEPLAEYFGRVIATDVHDYGYGEAPVDFLDDATRRDADWIITNPPFLDKAIRFVLRALRLARVGVAMFVRLQWLETIERYELIFSRFPPTVVAFFVERVPLCKGRWNPDGDTLTAYCWLVWVRDKKPRPPFWIPPGCRERLTCPDDVARFATHPVIHKASASTPPRADDDGLGVPDFLRRQAS